MMGYILPHRCFGIGWSTPTSLEGMVGTYGMFRGIYMLIIFAPCININSVDIINILLLYR